MEARAGADDRFGTSAGRGRRRQDRPPPAERSDRFLKFDDLRKDAILCYDWSCATLFV